MDHRVVTPDARPARALRRAVLRPALGLGLALALAGLGTSCQSSANDNGAIQGSGQGQTSIVTMSAMNGGQSGSATLLESPSLVFSIEIDLTGAPSTVQEPASVHAGTCSAINPATAFALSSVISGTSRTTNLNTTLDELSSTPYVIVVSRSGLDATPVSCGPIPQVSPAPGGGISPTP